MVPRRALLVVLALLAAGRARADDPPPAAPEALDDPSWDVRREAEATLFREGELCLRTSDGAPDGRERLAAWSRRLEAATACGTPTALAAVRRVITRLEALGDDEQVRRVPALLRARIERHLPEAVREREPGQDLPLSARSRGAAVSLEGLFPEARPLLLEVVVRDVDPRRLAAAIVVLARAESGGEGEAALHEAIARRWAERPARLLEVGRYVGADGAVPAVTVGLALALAGRAGDAALVVRSAGDPGEGLVAMLRDRLPALGAGDLVHHEFLGWALGGDVGPSEAVDAAVAAEKAGLPWIARLNARRALFLDPEHALARTVLVRADAALGLHATAREDARGGALPEGTGTEDDPAARRVDAALRAGVLHQRILYRTEVGRRTGPGLVPVAFGPGALVYGTTGGRVVLADPETGAERLTVPSEAATLPRCVAATRDLFAAVSASRELLVWSRSAPDAPRLAHVRGDARFLAVAAAPDGGFFAVGEGRAVWRVSPQGEAAPVPAVRREAGFDPRSVAVLADGTLLLASERAAQHVDPATGTAKVVLRDRRDLRVAAYGQDFVAIFAGRCGRYGTDGSARWSQPAGALAGVAADAAAQAVYVTLTDSVVALDADDGSLRWTEAVEGAGPAAVGEGLLAVPAGAGGDQRRDRTITVLRSSPPDNSLFEAAARKRLLEVALEAAHAGRRWTARLLVDPLRGWLTAAEAAPLEAALEDD